MTQHWKVAVTRRLTPAVVQALEARAEVEWLDANGPPDAGAVARALASCDGLVATVADRVTADVFDAAAPVRARIVANFGVGYGNIDVAAAARHGVMVSNTPDVLTDDTADLALLLLLMAARRAGEGERLVRAGAWTGWEPTQLLGTRLRGRVLGIVGMGRIGAATARRAAEGLGMRVRYWTRSAPPPERLEGLAAERVGELDELLRGVDAVSLHVPSTSATRHLLDARRLALLPRGAIVVNTARGDVIDEAALAEALASGHLGGVGLDVYEHEPEVHPALLASPRAVLLPHLGSATVETRDAMGLRALDNLWAALEGRAPPDRVG